MATNQKSNSKKSNRSQTKPSGSYKKAGAKVAPQESSPFKDEIIIVFTLMISILLILSNFNLAGPFGGYINYFIFGVFGIVAYMIPYLLFLGEAFYISNRSNKTATRKLRYFIMLFLISTGLVQMISGMQNKDKVIQYYRLSAETKSGGGIIGGTISTILCNFFGEAGTYVILIALILIFLILITEKLLFAGIKNRGNKAVINMREKHQLNQDEKEDAVARGSVPRRKAKTFTFQSLEENNNNSSIKEKKSATKSSSNKAIYEEELSNKFNNSKNYDIKGLANQQIQKEEVEIKIQSSNPGFSFEEENEGQLYMESGEKNDIIDKIPAKKTQKKEKKIEKQKPLEDMEISVEQAAEGGKYIFPPVHLLSKPKNTSKGMTDKELKETALKLQSTLESFGVRVTVTNVSCGPSVTRYELQPEQGVKVSKITNLADDIKLNLAAADVRIEAPIPGKAAVGIEVPNRENTVVMFRSLIESKEFNAHPSNIAFAVGKDIGGQTVVTDIAKMPHLLIAGATGSGKSICINTIIMSILYKADPNDVKLIMVDPKVVELSVYNGIPHLLIPVVTDPKKASAALNWAVMEMTERYNRFADLGVRDIKGYNEKVSVVEADNDEKYKKMPQIVIIVDELADLMMVAPGEVEDAICRLAQMARAAGLHLIIATQRPSVNVITGLIKANVPSRIAFSVSSAIDSRTIIDGSGAEKLLGKGDMLFFPSGYPKPVRIQGAFVSDKEVSSVVEFLSAKNSKPQYQEEIANKINSSLAMETSTAPGNDRDEYFIQAGKFIIEKDKASIGMLQRVYKIGFNRAARIMDQLCDAGVVGPEEGTKPRKVLMSPEEFEQYMEEYV